MTRFHNPAIKRKGKNPHSFKRPSMAFNGLGFAWASRILSTASRHARDLFKRFNLACKTIFRHSFGEIMEEHKTYAPAKLLIRQQRLSFSPSPKHHRNQNKTLELIWPSDRHQNPQWSIHILYLSQHSQPPLHQSLCSDSQNTERIMQN